MTNPLRAYLDREGIPASDFADRLAISKSYLSRLMSGEREADATLLARIHEKTSGKVRPDAWVRWRADQDQQVT